MKNTFYVTLPLNNISEGKFSAPGRIQVYKRILIMCIITAHMTEHSTLDCLRIGLMTICSVEGFILIASLA